MYMDDNWTPSKPDALAGFLDQINPIDGKYRVSPETTDVGYRSLPFYDNVQLIRVKDPNWTRKNLFIYYLTLEENLFRLNGTSPPIHEVNAKAPVKINEDNVLDYLDFFCFYVRGEEGPFLIAHSLADTYVPKRVDDDTRYAFESAIEPPFYEGQNEKGHFMCEASVYYSNAIFEAQFAVQPTGMIEMIDDNPIVADLPVKIDAPIA